MGTGKWMEKTQLIKLSLNCSEQKQVKISSYVEHARVKSQQSEKKHVFW